MTVKIQNISANEYHADRLHDKPSLSASIAWEMEPSNISAGSPMHGWLRHPRFGNQGKKKTDAMKFGTICHSLLLGTQEEYALAPFKDYKTKDAQIWRDETESSGKIPVKKEEMDEARNCVRAWKQQIKELRLEYVLTGENEASISWNEDEIYCRARIDIIVRIPNGTVEIWDLKTMPKAHPKKVLRKVIDEGLALKSEFYKRALSKAKPQFEGRIKHGFLFLSVDDPYLICPVPELDGQFQMIGRKQVDRSIETWGKCLKENKWPGYEPIKRLECPHWNLMEEITEGDDE